MLYGTGWVEDEDHDEDDDPKSKASLIDSASAVSKASRLTFPS